MVAVAASSRDYERYLTGKQVRARYGNISRMTLFRWQHDPFKNFPAPVPLSEHKYWRLSDLIAWEQSRVTKAASKM
jgi:predicted DNA-binding transcriptional regulator AlpA